MRLTLAVAVVSTFLSLVIATGHAQVAPPVSEVKITVVDENGARIADGELVFKAESKTVVSHTGSDGAVRVALPNGQYAVTASHLGFLKNEVPNFQIVAPEPKELRIVLKVASCKNSSCILGPDVGAMIPTITSDLPTVVEDAPSPVPPAQPATETRKSRSLRCLYLWKCSTS
jgi:hypothetical protein